MEIAFLIKAGAVILLLAVIASLAVALVRLVQDRGRTTRTVKALTLRIGISVLLFVLLVLAVLFGLVEPHGVTP